MTRQDELGNLVRQVLDVMDYTYPAEWHRMVDEVLSSGTAPVADDEGSNPAEVGAFRRDYVELKGMILMMQGSMGPQLGRNFWEKVSEPGGGAGGMAAVLGIGAYNDLVVRSLALEMIHAFTERELPEPERLNDAGFDNHHPGGYERAVELHDRALALAPDFSMARINKGIALKNLGRLDEAIACYDHVIEQIDDRFKKAWHNKGVALLQQQRLEEAVECFARAVQIDPEYENARQARDSVHRLLQESRQKPSAEDTFANADDPRLKQMLMMTYRLQNTGDWDAAVRMIEQIMAAFPDEEMRVDLGNCLYEAGRREEARETWLEEAGQRPINGLAWLNLARYDLENQRPDSVLETTDKATRYAPDHPMSWANRAGAMVMHSRFAEGATAAERCIDLDPQNAIGLYYAGICWTESGNLHKGHERLRRLLELYPDFAGASVARRLLGR